MDADAFTLAGIAFPVAPANLDGFTIDGFQWTGGPEPDEPIRLVFEGTIVTRHVFSEENEAMPAPELQKNVVGAELVVEFIDEAGTAIDISTASTKQILLRKPGSATVTKSGTFDTDGTDGLLKYVTTKVLTVYDLDRAGRWQIQGYAVVGTNEWHTKVNTFEVAGNLN